MSKKSMNINARQLARIGAFYLQEAVLEVLDGAGKDGLRLGRIATILDLPEQGYESVVTGQLKVLQGGGKVHQPRGKRTEWTLTDAEREGRKYGLD